MSKKRKSVRRTVGRMAGVLATMAPLCVATAHAEDTKIYGDVSAAFSWNTQNTLKDNLAGSNRDTKGKLSMARFTLKLNIDSTVNDNISWVGKFRLVKDASTDYLRTLEKLGADAAGHNDLSRLYSEGEIRELYMDIKPSSNVMLRLGKQQVVWGESDFFQAMDMVHGYNFMWRSFLEPANEDLRKPSVMANLTIQVPELDGKVQALFRPGALNKHDSIGNTFDIQGGRWANQPLKSVDFLAVTPYNYEVRGADARDNTWGLRWSGMASEINYSLSYLKTFNPVPVISMRNDIFSTPGTAGLSGSTPFEGNQPIGLAGEVIYPKIDLFGLTASGYSAAADAVFSTEVAYIRDFAYNYGQTSFYSGALGGPGYDGVKRKDVIRSMFRMDKNLAFTQSLLGTEKPAFFSVQLFDTWIRDFNSKEDLVQLVGFGQRSKEHSSLLTVIFDTSYANGTINPGIVAGRDLSYGGGFIVPSIAFQFGKDWRLKLEYDHFFGGGERTFANNNIERNTSLFGYFANNNQFYAKVTYQF
ncbi:DUF1302 family protein [Denitratisoma sp. DHT3]|uniref:DUF1302 family protein n=1 Tax=Denitratisoma sp. DHT3 TaxID=1981880 RepID=UPI0011A763AD|nr:DUF1302 family protein [Denitratisoma sp. DHT3]